MGLPVILLLPLPSANLSFGDTMSWIGALAGIGLGCLFLQVAWTERRSRNVPIKLVRWVAGAGVAFIVWNSVRLLLP
jgi:hypothetical protein